MRRMVCIGLGIGLIALIGTADADETARLYRIPPQSLDSSLLRLAADSGLEILFTADQVRGVTGNGLDGSMTPAQALARLLQGSGMTYRFVDAKTVTVEAPDANFRKTANVEEKPEPQSSGSDATLPKVTVEADAGDPYDDPNWANDPYNKAYTTRNSSTATKTDTPIFDTPVSVQVVPRSVMDDQKTTRLKDALENVSGVRAQPTLGMGTGFIIRGFRQDQIFRNGLLTTQSNGFNSEFDTANLESIEVLKGPAAMLYGRGEPGGLINLTTKKALDIPYYSLEQQFGSYDYYRTQWDATGPINKDKTLLYRFSGSYQNNNSFRDLIFTDRVMVSPSVTWNISDSTDLSLNIEGMEQNYQADFGIPAIGKRPAPIPISNTFGDTNDPVDHLSKIHLGTLFNHRFNEDWAIHNRFLMSREQNQQVFVNPSPAFDTALKPDNRTLTRNIFSQDSDVEAYATRVC